ESPIPDSIVEWIEFRNLMNVKFLAEGGFGKVYSATWTPGKITGWNEMKNTFVRKSKKVALKVFNDDGPPGDELFREAHWSQIFTRKRNFRPCVVNILGFTKNQEGKYGIVLDLCEGGDLRNYLQKHYKTMNWKDKVKVAWDIAFDIQEIIEYRSKQEGEIMGVLPYMAPELLCGGRKTQESDIYSFGIIMWTISAGCVPFNDRHGDPYLANDIICGLRPSIIPGTSKKYADLMCKCWAKDPHDRISAKDAVQILRVLLRDMMENNFIDEYSTEKNSSWNPPKFDFSVFLTSERLIISNLTNSRGNSHSNSDKLILYPKIHDTRN
ncbi:13050_t:CDS:2, partial [Dentiscutata heterogama]